MTFAGRLLLTVGTRTSSSHPGKPLLPRLSDERPRTTELDLTHRIAPSYLAVVFFHAAYSTYERKFFPTQAL